MKSFILQNLKAMTTIKYHNTISPQAYVRESVKRETFKGKRSRAWWGFSPPRIFCSLMLSKIDHFTENRDAFSWNRK